MSDNIQENSHFRLDILDELQEEDNFIFLKFASGEVRLGLAHGIVWEEAEDGWATIKTILFQPYGTKRLITYTEEEIQSYTVAQPDQLPPMAKGAMDWWSD